jgi:hypothetical protein
MSEVPRLVVLLWKVSFLLIQRRSLRKFNRVPKSQPDGLPVSSSDQALRETDAMIITKLVRLAIIDVHERTSLAEKTERLDAAFITLNRVKVSRISATSHQLLLLFGVASTRRELPNGKDKRRARLFSALENLQSR